MPERGAWPPKAPMPVIRLPAVGLGYFPAGTPPENDFVSFRPLGRDPVRPTASADKCKAFKFERKAVKE